MSLINLVSITKAHKQKTFASKFQAAMCFELLSNMKVRFLLPSDE